MRSKPKITQWILFLLIILFFAIPVLALSIADQVSKWPKCPASSIWRILPK